MSTRDIIQSIATGNHDDDLQRIRTACEERRKAAAFVAVASAEIGDPVEINDTCRPKYLVGTRGTIKKINEKSFKVKFDDPVDPRVRRYDNGTVPKTLVTLLPLEESTTAG